ncbi:hypothetical protein CGMCC3_g6972 [Colletotrichum fructicola]|nr:uncharacterized protein CGMCC3_g6972 [Colletotrichum fructicola]KAE9577089.1 hypothetical protein CGMCC3_g6972 [Colletotrichum fructicola]
MYLFAHFSSLLAVACRIPRPRILYVISTHGLLLRFSTVEEFNASLIFHRDVLYTIVEPAFDTNCRRPSSCTWPVDTTNPRVHRSDISSTSNRTPFFDAIHKETGWRWRGEESNRHTQTGMVVLDGSRGVIAPSSWPWRRGRGPRASWP